MKGFDAEFLNLDHYIRVITERIWEGGAHRRYLDLLQRPLHCGNTFIGNN